MIFLTLILMIAPALSDFFSIDRNYEISTKKTSDQLGHIVYEQTSRQSGWNKLYIYTSPQVSPQEQHRAAGFLQGYATYSQIYSAFVNFAGLDFKGQLYAPIDVQQFLDNQLQFMDLMVASNQNDPFWAYVGYYLDQVRYMHAGYQARIKKEKLFDLQLQFKQLFYLTSIGDLEDLLPWEKGFAEQRKNCNAYIRLDNETLYITHGTHNRYSFLLRIFKTWNFPRKGVPLQSTSFTSRPGDLISKDDFFILSSGLRVLQTSLANNIQQNLKEVKPNTVPSWLRTLVANHLSVGIDDWIQYFNTYRSGTHNNQWILIDPSKVSSKKDIVYFFQEAFTMFKVVDMTPQLLRNGYIAGYNTPITSEIYEKLGYNPVVDGTYRNESRAIILKRYHPKMKTIEDMKYWLINNEQQNIKQSLAPRWDLLAEKAVPFGMTDCKVTSPQILKDNYFWAISSPPTSHGRFAPFDWKNWEKYPHSGLEQVYDYGWQKITLQVEATSFEEE